MANHMIKFTDKERRKAIVLSMIEALNEKGVSGYKISRVGGVSRVTLLNWTQETHAPSVTQLLKIDKVYRRFCHARKKRKKKQIKRRIKKRRR